MITKETLIKISNRENGKVGYTIPELGGLRRQFEPNESKEVPMDELRKLSYIPGGKVLMSDYLIIENQEAVEELLGSVEPEYFYKTVDVENLLLNGTIEELQDCLDFAPQGVLDEVKTRAIKLKINDMRKREVIEGVLGFNINKAIEIEKEIEMEADKIEPKKRRVSVSKDQTTEEPKRRTAPPKYKVVY